MQTNKNKQVFNSYFIIGCMIILFIVWNRFLRVRAYIGITDSITMFKFISILVMTLLFFVLIIYNYNQIQKNTTSFLYKKINSYALVTKITRLLSKFLTTPSIVFEQLYKYIYIKPIAEYLGVLFENYISKYKLIFYLLTDVIPKATVAISFLVDILIYQRFYYFYNLLIILAIPLIVSCGLYIIEYHAQHNFNYITHLLDFKEYDNKIIITTKPNLSPEEKKIADNSNETYCYNLCVTYSEIIRVITEYKEYKYKYIYTFNVIYYTLYFIGFTYYTYVLLIMIIS